MVSAAQDKKLSRKDFQTDQEVRWCPGCGDYAILASVQKFMPKLGIPKEKIVFVSGIGCSSRFPYYMETFGFHSIHGRAPAVASGVKIANPDLSVWVITGDGDGLSIGGNHLIHALRRNISLKVLLFNNRIYGLTKGQYSPTSEPGKKTKSTPYGSVDNPFNPLKVALGADATFVARSIDVDPKHLATVLEGAARHEGGSFVEIYQNCNVFNDHAFAHFTGKDVKKDSQLHLKHGEPMIFGKDSDRGIRMNGFKPEVVRLGNGVSEEDLLVHDAHEETGALAFLLAQLEPPHFPVPIGIFRDVKRPVYEDVLVKQVDATTERLGKGKIHDLLRSGQTWEVS